MEQEFNKGRRQYKKNARDPPFQPWVYGGESGLTLCSVRQLSLHYFIKAKRVLTVKQERNKDICKSRSGRREEAGHKQDSRQLLEN